MNRKEIGLIELECAICKEKNKLNKNIKYKFFGLNGETLCGSCSAKKY